MPVGSQRQSVAKCPCMCGSVDGIYRFCIANYTFIRKLYHISEAKVNIIVPIGLNKISRTSRLNEASPMHHLNITKAAADNYTTAFHIFVYFTV